MNLKDLRDSLRDRLLLVTPNVEDVFSHPEARAEEQKEFPYITIVFGEAEVEGKRATQNVSIIGIVKDDDEVLFDRLIELQNSIYTKLYNEQPKIVVNTINLTNIFQPFGLDAAVFPPYAGVRFECTFPSVILEE